MTSTREVDAGTRRAKGPALRPGLLMGLAAGLAVLSTLGDPGLTVDEPLDVRPGRTYVSSLRSHGLGFFGRQVVDRVFRDNAEHPPLGRWLLGIASTLGEPFEILWRGADPTGLYVVSGRLAPALCFAILAAAVTVESTRRWGRAAGLAAGWSLLAMPRVFAHAHLAALDTFLIFFWTLALLAGARALDEDRSTWRVIGAGALWALALLTKIHAWLLLPIMLVWAAARIPRRRAVVRVGLWAATGVVLFVAGWPWLWYDTWGRWKAYWGTSVERATILVEYFGRIYRDRDVPWHYPWLYFAVTVPVGLQLLGTLGLGVGWRRRKDDPFVALLAGSIILFLAIFSTGVPVYDGERLYLLVFPAWAMLIGLGFGELWERWGGGRGGRIVLTTLLIAQGYGTVALHPFGLSYYNLLAGGLPGAERLGLELTYWNDAVDRVILDRLAAECRPGDVAALVPTLYPGQGVLTTTSPLARREVILQDETAAGSADWLVVSRRRAYWNPTLLERWDRGEGRLVSRRSRQGVWLSALWHFPRAEPAAPPGPPRETPSAAPAPIFPRKPAHSL
jgi:4-amino-4-deoxy-L-arabinose transferase-like glycosyltransferase